MSKKFLRNLIIICVAAFVMAIVSVILCANYLFSYTPDTTDDKPVYYVTDEAGETQVIESTQLEGAYNFLILGHDRAAMLTDVIMLVNYDINNKAVTILQFPRDSYVSANVSLNKINASYSTYYTKYINEGKTESESSLLAIQEFASVLENALGISIYKEAIMDLDGFVNIVDALGGVEVNVPSDLYYVDEAQNLYINLKAGYQTLNGNQAEQFVRFRKGYLQADIGRENAQKIFMSALLKKVKASISVTNVGLLTDLATEILDNLTTDITVADFVYLAKGLISDVDLSNVRMITVPGDCLYHECGISYYVANRARLAEIISSYFNTTDVSTEILEQNVDKNQYFNDRNSANLSGAYFSTEVPPYEGEYVADEVNENSIDIPRAY